MSATIRTDEQARTGTAPITTGRQPPEVLSRGNRPTPARHVTGGLRAGYGLDWLLVRADGRPADRVANGKSGDPR